MTTDGKFILMDITEFEPWLASKKVSRAINNLQMHHTWLPNYNSFNGSNHIALVKNMESYHLSAGFSEIAQHLTTYPDGKICVCRDLGKDGAGISKRNTGGTVVENIGDFDTEQMIQKQREAIICTSVLLCKKFNIPMQINSDGNTMIGGVYINVTVSMGVMGGYVDFTFKPEDEITRAEMAVVINNLLRLLDKSCSCS